MIKVTEKLFIDGDEYQYIVKKYLGDSKKDGTPMYAALTYHTNLEDALESILNRQQRLVVSQNDMDLTETLEKFKSLKNEILGVLEDVRKVEVIKND